MADTENEVLNKAMTDGASDLDAIMNPQQYVQGMNNPLAKGLMAAYSGLKAGIALPRMSGTGGDIAAILSGAMGAQAAEQDLAKQQMEMAPLSMVSPQLAEAFPEVADMPNKQAYDLIGKLQTYFSQKIKGQPLDMDDVPAIKASLMAKGFTQKDADTYAPSFVGQSWDIVKNVPKKDMFGESRLEAQRRRGEVQEGSFGVSMVPITMNYKPYGATPIVKEIPANKKIDEGLRNLGQIQERVNAVYDRIIELAKAKGMAVNVAVESYLRSDPEAKSLLSNADLLLPQIAKGYSGDVGNLNEFEQQRARSALPNFRPSFLGGMPDTIATLEAKKKTFNDMVNIGKKLQYSAAIKNSLSTVKGGIFGNYQGYVDQLKQEFSNEPDFIEMLSNYVSRQSPPATGKTGKGKTLDVKTATVDDIMKAAGGGK